MVVDGGDSGGACGCTEVEEIAEAFGRGRSSDVRRRGVAVEMEICGWHWNHHFHFGMSWWRKRIPCFLFPLFSSLCFFFSVYGFSSLLLWGFGDWEKRSSVLGGFIRERELG